MCPLLAAGYRQRREFLQSTPGGNPVHACGKMEVKYSTRTTSMPRPKKTALPGQNGRSEELPRSEQAHRYLRDAIRSGRLRPGDRLREVDLAAAIGLSRTPVREALARLEAEGLVVNDSIRGIVVTELDYSMVTELYVMREVLEGTAARLAAQHASEVEMEILDDLCEQYRAALDDSAEMALRNRQFHETLCRCAHNRYLLKMLNMLHDSLSLLGPTSLALPDRAVETLREHEAVVEAIRQRDSEGAEAAVRTHIRAAQKTRVMRLFAQG